jgi:hypothetical protein
VPLFGLFDLETIGGDRVAVEIAAVIRYRPPGFRIAAPVAKIHP